MNSQPLRKIIWAVNILEEMDSRQGMLTIFSAMARSGSMSVEPVFILSPPYAHAEGAPKTEYELAYLALAEKKMAELKKTCGLSLIADGQILINRQGSVRHEVKMIVDHARQRGADAIAVSTHGRKGAARFFMGSFAESLILSSDIPVLTLNPQAQVHERIRKILLPTEFSSNSEPAFEKALALARTLEASLTLFYKEPFLAFTAMNPEVYAFIAEESVKRRETAALWQARAAKQGVQARILIDDKPGYLPEAIESLVVAEGFDLIAMGTQADRTTAVVAGSAARQTVRQAGCPVWVTRIGESQAKLY